MPGGEMVRTYLSRGDYFGEIGLLRSIKRTATCTALDAVDVVKIPAADFNLMLETFPGVRQQIEAVASARFASGQMKTIPAGLHLDDFLNQGETETGPVALRRKERLKDALPRCRWNPGAVVGNVERSFRSVLPPGGQLDFAVWLDRLSGVEDQIEERLTEELFVRLCLHDYPPLPGSPDRAPDA